MMRLRFYRGQKASNNHPGLGHHRYILAELLSLLVEPLQEADPGSLACKDGVGKASTAAFAGEEAKFLPKLAMV